MDKNQSNHLKAYGLAYWVLEQGEKVDWLLNYKGGSFMLPHIAVFEKECQLRGIGFNIISDGQTQQILNEIAEPSTNMDIVRLEKVPKVAVYSPKTKLPWDDAVTLVLSYAQIPYTVVYDEEVINGELPKYDWLHLHHEDFTGQYGKFWSQFRNAAWYVADVQDNEARAAKLGFNKVSQMKLAVAQRIKEFTLGGGFLFAMCSATDTYDIALAAQGHDICQPMFDGDPIGHNVQSILNYDYTLAFKNFRISTDPYEYEHANIDVGNNRPVPEKEDYFALFEFSAKWDPVPTMLCQNHERVIKGFMGQTTAFKKGVLKPDVLVMGDNSFLDEARYIHGELGEGTWTFYGGHDPEDYRHLVGDPPTDLVLFPNSPGYRLILNNILFPAAKKKKQKT
jgi:hypothetical protein